jgi:predicted phage baseplate assembly protein
VTIEDYEDLALLASPEVARALCVPLRNLADDPLGNTVCPGETSVIIVPRSEDDKPLPSLELISRVREYLVDNSVPTANVSVVGPEYVRVDVTAEIALVSLEGASAVEQAVREKLAEFLHPLTGGADGTGWDFGREPYKSDFYALLHGISGVDYVRSLDVPVDAGDADIKETGRFLVYSGNHTISLIFDGTDTES